MVFYWRELNRRRLAKPELTHSPNRYGESASIHEGYSGQVEPLII